MLRRFPEVGALYERVRRPATMFVVGLVLVAPATGMLARRASRAWSGPWRAGQVKQVAMATTAATAGSAAREVAADRGRNAVVERFARQYGVSVPLAREIYAAAREYGIDPKVAFGLVRTESSFRRTVVSHAGAVGYAQVLPSTARWIEPGTTRSRPVRHADEPACGFKYLRYLMDRYNGECRLALTAYNRGPGTVDRVLARGGNPDNGYARKVLRG